MRRANGRIKSTIKIKITIRGPSVRLLTFRFASVAAVAVNLHPLCPPSLIGPPTADHRPPRCRRRVLGRSLVRHWTSAATEGVRKTVVLRLFHALLRVKSFIGIRRRELAAHQVVRPVLMLAATWGFFAHGLIGADATNGPIVAVQEALKKQQLLSAEPTGVLDFQTRAALRKFQTQRGLQPTGEIDTPTLEALQKQAAAAPPDKAGREPIKAIVKEDGEFLKRVEKAPGAETTSQPTGVTAPTAPAPPPPTVAPPTIPSAEVQQFPVVPPPPAPGVAAPAVTPPLPAPPAPDRPPNAEPPTSAEQTPTSTVAEPEKKIEKVSGKTEAVKNRVTEKTRSVATRKRDVPVAQTDARSSPERRESQPAGADPTRGTESGIASGPTPTSTESALHSGEPVGRSGKRPRTSRTPPVARGPETKTSTYPATPVPVRRAEAVQPARRDGFFDRLFKDD